MGAECSTIRKLLFFSIHSKHDRGLLYKENAYSKCISYAFYILRFGLLPYRKPIHVVIGRPIVVEKTESPTKEDIESMHQKYIDELKKLYEKYNPIYGDQDVKLIIE